MSFFLVTTADERTWMADRPILFLSESCRLYHRKNAWKDLDAVVAPPRSLGIEDKKKDLAYVLALARQITQELGDALNAFHRTEHTFRYWNILLGHWVHRYVSV